MIHLQNHTSRHGLSVFLSICLFIVSSISHSVFLLLCLSVLLSFCLRAPQNISTLLSLSNHFFLDRWNKQIISHGQWYGGRNNVLVSMSSAKSRGYQDPGGNQSRILPNKFGVNHGQLILVCAKTIKTQQKVKCREQYLKQFCRQIFCDEKPLRKLMLDSK